MSALIHTLADGKKKEKKKSGTEDRGGVGEGEGAAGKRSAYWERKPPATHFLVLPRP